MPFRLSSLAEQDLEEIWSYVAEDASPTTADRLIDAIFDRFELLVERPRIGRSRKEFGEGVRSFVVESYVICYRHDLAILHTGIKAACNQIESSLVRADVQHH